MASGARSQDFLANLDDFLKNFGQKGVGVRPLRPPLWIRAWVDKLCLLGYTYHHFKIRISLIVFHSFFNDARYLPLGTLRPYSQKRFY